MAKKIFPAIATFFCLFVSSVALAVSPATQPAKWPFDAAEAIRRRDDTAKALGVPVETTVDLGNNVAMKFSLIPPGRFIMGSPEPEKEREDTIEQAHPVTLTKAYYIQTTPVTRAQFAAFVNDTQYKTEAEKKVGISVGSGATTTWKSPGFEQGDDHPVVLVSWNDAVAYADWLSKKQNKKFRLPTEAEWEYACRAGANTQYWFGVTIAVDQANYDGNTRYRGGKTGIYRAKTTPVGTFAPNVWGLFDMHGNVWQWTNDYLAPFREKEEAIDPTGPAKGIGRVFRGGSWYDEARDCRCACRGSIAQGNRAFDVGFRVVLEVSK